MLFLYRPSAKENRAYKKAYREYRLFNPIMLCVIPPHESKQKRGENEDVKKGELIMQRKDSANRLPLKRRTFLKGSAAALAAGTAALALGCAPGAPKEETAPEPEGTTPDAPVEASAAPEAPEELVVPGICRGGCGAGCQMNVHVRDGKIVKTSRREQSIPDTTRLCNRGLTHALRVYAENRIQYPMRRAGERGEGKWERISWDEATTIITDKWKEVAETYGPAANAFLKGSGNITPDAHLALLLQRTMGATRIDPAADRALYVAGPASLGYSQRFCGSGYEDVLDAKNIIIWGWNPTESSAYQAHYYLRAHQNGAKLIVIDPTYTILASKADMFVPIHPGTDGALAMALINVLVEEGLADEAFLAANTVAPLLVKDSDGTYLRLSDLGRAEAGSEADALVVRTADGSVVPLAEEANPVIHGSFEIEGIAVTCAYDLLIERASQWTPEAASELTEVPAETIRELASILADGPTTVGPGLGLDHYTNGVATFSAVFAAAMVAGQYGKPGSGIKASFTTEFAFGWDSSAPLTPADAPKSNMFYSPALLNCIDEGYYGDEPIDIKTLYIWNHNLFVTEVGIGKWRQILDGAELIVVTDVVMTSTAEQADIVLPACHYFECEAASGESTKYVFYNAKAAEPLYESKSDFDIANMLFEKMGLADKSYKTVDDLYEALFDNPTAQQLGLTWDRVKSEGAVLTASADPYVYGADGIWNTATGRLQFYQEVIPLDTDYGQSIDHAKDCLPYWEPPMECWKDNELAEKYPFVFTSERSKYRVHSQFDKIPWLLDFEEEPYVMVNPADCKEKGIADGDYVRLFNDRGTCILRARFNDGIRPGMIVIDHGWERDQFVDGFYSELIGYNVTPVVANSYYFDALIDMEKATV